MLESHLLGVDAVKIVKTLGAAVALTVVSGAAMAADLPSRRVAPVMAAPVFTWTGFYVGANLGVSFGNDQYVTAPTGTLVTAPFFGSRGWGTGLSNQRIGILGGVQAGYNFQLTDRIVVGAEADFQLSNWGGRESVVSQPGAFVTTSVANRQPWFGTVRSRIGITPFDPRFMIYATGGLAYGRSNETASIFAMIPTGQPLELFPFSFGSTRMGWAAGAGVEWAMTPNWSIKGEWLHIDLKGRSGIQATTFFGPQALPQDIMFYQSKHYTNVFRAGVNYRFGWGSTAPVVAKY